MEISNLTSAGKRRKFEIALVCFFLFAFCGLAFTQNTPATDDFLYAQKLFNEGYYDLCVSQLRLYMQRYPDAQQTAEAWRLLGESNFALKKFASAREAFESYEIRYPSFPAIEPVRLRIAECFEKQNEPQNAALSYHRFVLVHPKSEKAPEAQYHCAEMWLRAGDHEKAREALYELLDDYAGSDYRLPAHLLLVQSFETAGDTKRALDEAERLMRSFPQSDLTVQAYFVRARLQEAVGQLQLAETSYQELVAHFAPAEEGKKTATSKARASVQAVQNEMQKATSQEWTSQAYARLAELAKTLGDLAGAISFLDKAEAQAPNAGAKNTLVLRRAEMLAEMRDYNRALQSLEKFDRADTGATHKLMYLYTIGRLQENLQNDGAAAEAYHQATQLPLVVETRSDSTNPQYRRQRSFWRGAAALMRLQKYQEALALCRAYRDEYPAGTFRDAVLLLEADIQSQGLNDYPAALRLYQALLEKFPNSALVDEAQWAIADTYEKIGEKRLASLEWQRLLKSYFASAHFAGAQNRLRALEEFEPLSTPESMAKLTQLILSLSRSANGAEATAELTLQLARLHFERREFEQAIDFCKQALQQPENNEFRQEPLLLLGTCYFKLGEKAKAETTSGSQIAWFDSAASNLRRLAKTSDAAENNDLTKRAGILLAQITFPPPAAVFGENGVLPRTPAMLAAADSTLALLGDDPALDYLRLWAAQTRKQIQTANIASPSTSRKILFAEADSLENERIARTLQKIFANTNSPQRNLAQLELADWHWLRGDSANAVRAMAQLQNSPLKDPNLAIGQLLLAKWLTQRKNFDLALDQLATMQKRYFYSALADSATLLRVRLLMAANRYSEALGEMQRAGGGGRRAEGGGRRANFANNESPGYDGLDLTRARAAEAIADYPLAIRSYLRFLQTHPQAPEAASVLLNAARLTKQVGATQLATSYYEECLQRFPRTPEAREAKINLAGLSYDADEFEAALALYMEVLGEAPTGDKVTPAPWEAPVRKQAVLCLYKLRKAAFAENESKIFKSRFPDDRNSLAEMQYAAGELATTEKNFSEAEKIFKKLRGDYRDTPSAIYGDYGLGKALLIQNKTEEALEVLTDIPRRYPKHPFLPTVYIGLGDFYQANQQWDNAITAFTKVMQDSAFDSNYRAAARYLINAYDLIGMHDRALALCRHYIARFPDDALTFNLRVKIGILMMNLMLYDDAISHFRGLKPYADAETEPEIQYYIGKSYLNAGKFEQAIAELLRVKFFSKPTKLPWGVTALYESAMCYVRLKNYDRAKQLFQQIVREQGAESEFGRFANAKLAELEAMGKNE
ncbi:tetratricopeptide repeat protein [candidate division KSB1 bacterium]|nr:tetratricopeptide repeat protein [candidate division KSB1 bacterium]